MKSVVAGDPGAYMLAQHLVLSGSQREIGRALAQEAMASFVQAPPPADPILNRARRRWFEHNWPQHYARMGGVADAFGVDLLDDRVSAADLPATPFEAGCSALWCPPASSADGHPRIGRNFDFMTGSVLEVAGLPPDPVQPPMMSRPYVIETYPDDGHASIAIAACDLSGCFDGCNDAGLAVALFADDESTTLRPTYQPQAGIHELQLPRFLLDTCTTADEAIEALYGTKQYDNFITCHYLVVDANGDAFVWERDTHNTEHVVRAGDDPFIVTNYLLHRHERVEALPEDGPTQNTYTRARILQRRAANTPLSLDAVHSALGAVRADGPDPAARTLWYSLYDLSERTLTVDFYLGETSGQGQQRSAPRTYMLERAA
jgi:Acyl-coenzyme A:6-aminopenicillanic acid acyl-transferase